MKLGDLVLFAASAFLLGAIAERVTGEGIIMGGIVVVLFSVLAVARMVGR